MATTLVGPKESFLHSSEDLRFLILYWCSGGGDMDRFFPSSRQHESWSRNYKWAPRERKTNQLNLPSPSMAVSQGIYSGHGQDKPIKVGSSTSVRSKDKRDSLSHTESPCGQGVTLRPEDLLGGSDELFSAYSRPSFPRSNPSSPHALSTASPSAYLLPSAEESRYGYRRMALSGSASELHTTAPQTQMLRRSSDGNYDTYQRQASTSDLRTGDPQIASKRRPVLHVPQASLDTSDSSISSLHNTRASRSNSSADVETFSSSTSSISGTDGEPTTTSSPVTSSSSSSSSKESRTSSGTQCSYCRLVSSGDSCDCCYCVCGTTCSVCSSNVERTAEYNRSNGKITRRKGDDGILPDVKVPEQRSNQIQGEQSRTRHSVAEQSYSRRRSRIATSNKDPSFNELPQNSSHTKAPHCCHSLGESCKIQNPSHLERRTPLEAQTVTHDENTKLRFSPVKKRDWDFDPKPSVIPDRRRSRRSTQRTVGDKVGMRSDENIGDKSQNDNDRINLRVYSPNAFNYHRMGSSLSRSRPRFASRQKFQETPQYNTDRKAETEMVSSGHRMKSHSLDYTTERHHSAPKTRKSGYRRSLSQSDLEDNSSCSKSDDKHFTEKYCLTSTDYNVLASKPRHKQHAENTAQNPTERQNMGRLTKETRLSTPSKNSHKSHKADENATKLAPWPPCRIALTKDISSESSESRKSVSSPIKSKKEDQKPQVSEKKRASKILHTKVTLVKREPSTNRQSKGDLVDGNTSKLISTDYRNAPIEIEETTIEPYTYRFRTVSAETVPSFTRSNRLHSCVHSPTRNIKVNVPEVKVESVEVPRSTKFETKITMKDTSNPQVCIDIPEIRDQIVTTDVEEPSTVITDLESTKDIVTESSSFVQASAEVLGVDYLGVDNSITDISESLRSTSFDKPSESTDKPSEYTEDTNTEDLGLQEMQKGISTDTLEITSNGTKNETSKAATEDDECSSSICLCDERITESISRETESKQDESLLSEEECSLCQREKSGRALSPDIVVLKTLNEVQQDTTEDKGKDSYDADSPPVTCFSDITEGDDLSKTSTVTSSTSALKTKTPDFLSADFPFEPEIVHKANPTVDEAGDEACLRNLGSPFRRMSEEEFIATLNIHDAAGKGDLHVVKLLVKKDHKQMETVDERGWTPIHLAAAHGHIEIVKYLAQEGAHLAALDPSSYTAIHLAAMNGHVRIVEMLLQLGVDVDCVTAEGFTPLHLAVMNAHLDTCQILLHWGASLEKRDAIGRSVQDMIEEYNLDEVAHLICRFKYQLKKFREVLKLIPPTPSGNGGGSIIAALSRLKESDVPKEILEMIASLSEEEET